LNARFVRSALAKLSVKTVQFGPAEPFFPGVCCIDKADEQSMNSRGEARSFGLVEKKTL
jgi:hypothetical protein